VKEICPKIVLEDVAKETLLETTADLISKNCILAWALTPILKYKVRRRRARFRLTILKVDI